jgi:hypothetical protein
MDTPLINQATPVTMSGDFTTKEATKLTMLCHDRLFKSVTIFSGIGEKLFTVDSKGMGSFTWRRTLRDTSGNAILDLRHLGWAMKNKWVVESPTGEEWCSLKHTESMGKERSALDIFVGNNGKETFVEVRPNDRSALTTMVNIEGRPVAAIQLVESNDVVNLEGLNRSTWEARTASGVDLTLVSSIPQGSLYTADSVP